MHFTKKQFILGLALLLSASLFAKASKTAAAFGPSWLDESVPSIYQTYKDQFDYFGIAAEYGNFGLSCKGDKYTGVYTWNKSWGNPGELYNEEQRKGISKHANSITLGNELKPQFLLAWWSNGNGCKQKMVDFTASNGQTIKVPEKLNNEQLIYATLNVCKSMGIQMRGHVLTWHSQTPDDFFAENYNAVVTNGKLTNPVDSKTMTARHEWYIKTVLGCVDAWEKANGYGQGNHIIYAWDVVNEACADDATKTQWARGSTKGTKDKAPQDGGSRWYQIYGSEEFIVNAFRFANAYAPSDVKLCYNDYNEYMNYGGGWKTDAICTLINTVKNGAAETVNGKSVKPRIDVMGMQSHVGISWPGLAGYETALKRFLTFIDVHVTELDFSAKTAEEAAKAYSDYFAMYQKYGNKSSGKYKIRSVTVWGICNEGSWINPAGDKSRVYPLLFNLADVSPKKFRTDWSGKKITYTDGTPIPLYEEGDTYIPNDSFRAVINAHK